MGNDTNSLKAYREIMDIKKDLKAITQLSWDINSVEKKYPTEKVPEEQLVDLLDIYRDLRKRLYGLILSSGASEEPF